MTAFAIADKGTTIINKKTTIHHEYCLETSDQSLAADIACHTIITNILLFKPLRQEHLPQKSHISHHNRIKMNGRQGQGGSRHPIEPIQLNQVHFPHLSSAGPVRASYGWKSGPKAEVREFAEIDCIKNHGDVQSSLCC